MANSSHSRRINVLMQQLRSGLSSVPHVSTFAAVHKCAAAAEQQPASRTLRVCVTGAAGNIGYSLAFMVAQGGLGNYKLELRLLDIPQMVDKVKGVEMELVDGAFPLITKIVSTADYKVAFTDCDVAMLVGARPRGPGMQRADLLKANASIFAGQGKALNQYASRDVKVVVVGNPANTNAMIAMANAPDLSPQCFSALTRLDQNRAVSQIAKKVGCPVSCVHNVIIWGNHSKTQYPDVNHAVIVNWPKQGWVLPVVSAVNDQKYLHNEFITCVQDRGAEIINVRKLSSAASAANAVIDHVHDWLAGTPPGQYVSMAIPSDGSYGVPKGIVYSFPVTISNGKFSIVQGLAIDEFSSKKMQLTAEELLAEKKEAGY